MNRQTSCYLTAQNEADSRAWTGRKIVPELLRAVEARLCAEQWSPEQISGAFHKEGRGEISHETIYQHIYRGKRAEGKLHRHLQHRCKSYRKRGLGRERRGRIKDQLMIEARAAVVAERSRIGDWERDTVLRRPGGCVLVTMVERKSRYTVIALVDSKESAAVTEGVLHSLRPMQTVREAHRKRAGGKDRNAGWQGFENDLVLVFDPKFEQIADQAARQLARYQADPYLLGYFTDNELPWKDDALIRHLIYLPPTDPGYLAAQRWLDARKGHAATVAEVTAKDQEDFNAFYFERYISIVTKAIRRYDTNHLYLGCRFNQETEELNSSAIFQVAGKYMDVVSINHYRKWEPDQKTLAKWGQWSGRPFFITEWYIKGEDSGLPNNTGAGWLVRTQKERGLFYQNFCLELLKSPHCVGWQWFKYQDNDPKNLQPPLRDALAYSDLSAAIGSRCEARTAG